VLTCIVLFQMLQLIISQQRVYATYYGDSICINELSPYESFVIGACTVSSSQDGPYQMISISGGVKWNTYNDSACTQVLSSVTNGNLNWILI
jgi:hypothetical protein